MNISVGKDESKNRIDVNAILSTVESNQWSFNKTQTSIMSKRTEDSEILKSLEADKTWMLQRYKTLEGQIQSLMGNHWPKFANSTVYNWTQAQLADVISQCKLVLNEAHPTINITDSMISEFAAKIISLSIQKDRMVRMLTNLNRWLNEGQEYRQKYKEAFSSIVDTLKDEDATETTVVTPQQGNDGYDQLKLFADKVAHHLQSKRQRNLQQYSIRKMVEKSLTPVTPTQNKENKQTKSKENTDELEL